MGKWARDGSVFTSSSEDSNSVIHPHRSSKLPITSVLSQRLRGAASARCGASGRGGASARGGPSARGGASAGGGASDGGGASVRGGASAMEWTSGRGGVSTRDGTSSLLPNLLGFMSDWSVHRAHHAIPLL